MKKTFLLLGLILITGGLLAQDVVGTWTGAIVIPEGELPINFNVSKAEGAYTSTLDSPAQNAFGIPVDTTTYENKELTIVVNSIQFKYTGTLQDKKTIKGKMVQFGQEFGLDLTLKED